MVQYKYWSVGNRVLAGSVLAAIVGMADVGQAHSPVERPSYGMPSWDQTLPAETRFVVLENFNSEAVLDQNTGLVWERSPGVVGVDWKGAKAVCLNKTIGGQRGWRLASIVELASLIDPSIQAPGPMLPVGHPFLDNPSGFYWSSSSEDEPSKAWHLHLSGGHVHTTSKTAVFKAWCVRGANMAD